MPSDADSLGVLLPGLQGPCACMHVALLVKCPPLLAHTAFAKDICFLQWSANITWPLQHAHTERGDPEMWMFALDVGGALRAHPHSES